MKKLMLALAVAGMSSVAMAQEMTEIPTDKYSVATNRFGSNWFVMVGGDFKGNYSNEEYGLGLSTNPFKKFRRSWAADLSVGKWFTPGLGLRIKADGAWGRQVVGDPSNFIHQYTTTAQAMFNLHNLFGGYKERIWNISLYGGAGAGVARQNGSKACAMVATAGILNTFNVSKRVFLDLDIYGVIGEPDFDKYDEGGSGKRFKGKDRQLGISVGVGVNLGKVGWSKTPDVDAIMALNKSQMDALNASLADQQAENARLKELLAKQPTKEVVKTVKEMASTTASVFFNLNSSRIASKKDLVNVKEIAEYAKANNSKIVVTGYADSKTGSPAYNAKLSTARANAVADQLVSMGVSRDNLIIEGKGGVADLSPISYNRRVTVKLQ